MIVIRDVYKLESLALKTTEPTTPEIPYESYASGSILIPAGSSITTLTWWGAAKSAKEATGAGTPTVPTFYAAQDTAGLAVTQTVAASKAYPIPVVLLGYAALKCVVNAAGSVDIVLKS